MQQLFNHTLQSQYNTINTSILKIVKYRRFFFFFFCKKLHTFESIHSHIHRLDDTSRIFKVCSSLKSSSFSMKIKSLYNTDIDCVQRFI